MRVRLKGLNSIRKRLADGTYRTYWYAWKGGPPLRGGALERLSSLTPTTRHVRARPRRRPASFFTYCNSTKPATFFSVSRMKRDEVTSS